MSVRAREGVVVLLCAAVAVGCGDGDQKLLVRGTMQRYLEAIADGNSDRACGVMTPTGRRDVVRMLDLLVPRLHASTCRQALSGLSKRLDDVQTGLLRDAKIDVDLNGDTATARPRQGTSSATLQMIDGRWLIDRVQF